jgi:hypothetical protein
MGLMDIYGYLTRVMSETRLPRHPDTLYPYITAYFSLYTIHSGIDFMYVHPKISSHRQSLACLNFEKG